MTRTSPATQLRLQIFRQEKCPDCSGPIVRAEGCATCPICGFSRCLA
jgi:hypothetical protein